MRGPVGVQESRGAIHWKKNLLLNQLNNAVIHRYSFLLSSLFIFWASCILYEELCNLIWVARLEYSYWRTSVSKLGTTYSNIECSVDRNEQQLSFKLLFKIKNALILRLNNRVIKLRSRLLVCWVPNPSFGIMGAWNRWTVYCFCKCRVEDRCSSNLTTPIFTVWVVWIAGW